MAKVIGKLTDKQSKELNELLEVRSKGRCEIRGIIHANRPRLAAEGVKPPACNGQWQHRHHKLRAGQGGDWDAENILVGCFPCHEWVHAHPTLSYAMGLLIKMSANL